MKIYKIQKESQNNFMPGEVPESALGNLGSPSVDISQLASSFPSINKALKLVNQFNSRLLYNITFIFNSSDQGSYGVYVPELDRVVKEKELKKRLEGKGYNIKNEGNTLVAYDEKGNKPQEEIQNDIDSLWKDLEKRGGSVFGVNMAKDLTAAQNNANIAKSNYPKEVSDALVNAMSSVTGSSSMEEFFSILEVGSTMVHEATHAMGAKDEAAPEAAEASFSSVILKNVNNTFMNNIKTLNLSPEMVSKIVPLEMNRKASKNSWYRLAQGLNYIPSSQNVKNDRPVALNSNKAGLPDWAMMNRNPAGDSIESKLGRQNMSPLPQGLSQENDIVELQLRKIMQGRGMPDAKLIHEELLQKDYVDESLQYRTTEELLDLNRPSPLLRPLKTKKRAQTKQASLQKIATLFGWMNNLEISDGNTIPGLSDRVMAWDWAEEDFRFSGEDIRKQPRYNPEYYDYAGGVYNAVVEPRFTPTLWDDFITDPSNTSPAKRFAQEKAVMDEDSLFVLKAINKAKKKILKKEIKATRFIATEDICKIISQIMNDENIKISLFVLDNKKYKKEDEEVFAAWIYNNEVDSNVVENIEKNIFHGNSNAIANKLIKLVTPRKNITEIIVNAAKEICDELKLDNVNIMGEYARLKFIGEENPKVDELAFNCCSVADGSKFAGMLAEKLGVSKCKYSEYSKLIYFKYNGVTISFYGGYAPDEIISLMKESNMNVDNDLLIDVCNRDFTINMGVYNLCSDTVDFPLKEFVPELGEINTLFHPAKLIRLNPIITLRALLLSLKYDWKINPRLERAMLANLEVLREMKDQSVLNKIVRYIKVSYPEKSKKLFSEYGLDFLIN